MKRRLLSIIMALAMIVSLVQPVFAEMEDDVYPEEQWLDVYPGGTCTMTVNTEYVTNDPDSLTYHWYQSVPNEDDSGYVDEPVAGDGPSLTVSFDDVITGDYSCNVIRDGGDVWWVSFEVTRKVNMDVYAKEGSFQLCPGMSCTLETVFENTGLTQDRLTFQWYLYDAAAGEDVAVPGANGPTLDVAYADADVREYMCTVTCPITGESASAYFVVNRATVMQVSEVSAVDEHFILYPGQSCTLQVRVTSQAPDLSGLTYSWETSDADTGEWVTLSGVDGPSLVVAYEELLSGQYYCYVSDGENTGSVWFNVEKGEGGYYVTGCDSDIYLSGAEAADGYTLWVRVFGPDLDAVTYQWYRYTGDPAVEDLDGTLFEAIPGATSATLPVTVTAAENLYRLDITTPDSDGPEPNLFRIHVDNSFSLDWEGDSYFHVELGAEVTLKARVNASDLPGVTLQWYYHGPYFDPNAGGTDAPMRGVSADTGWAYDEWELIEGATSEELSLTVEGPEQVGEYMLCAEDRFGDRRTCDFTVYFENGFRISAVDPNLSATPGQTVRMQVVIANGADTDHVIYQWARSNWDEEAGQDVYTPIPGATSDYLDVVPDGEYSSYTCFARDGYGGEDSAGFSIYVYNHLSMEIEGDYQEIHPGETATFRAVVTGDSLDGLVCQWYAHTFDEDGNISGEEPIEGATSDTFTTPPLYEYTEYMCQAHAAVGEWCSAWCRVYVNNEFSADYDGESSFHIRPGETATMAVAAQGWDLSRATYSWYLETYSEENDEWTEEKLDETGPECESLPVYGSAQYRCDVADSYGGEQTLRFWIYAENDFHLESDGDNTVYVTPGETVTLTAVPGGWDLSHVTYQWYRWEKLTDDSGNEYEDWAPIDGAVEASWTTDPVTVSATYRCVALDGYGADACVDFYVNIDNGFDLEPEGDTYRYVEPGGTAVLTVVPYGNDVSHVTYQWYRWGKLTDDFGNEYDDWAPIDGAVEATYTTEPVTGRADYLCIAKDGFGSQDEVGFWVYVENGFSAQAAVDQYPGVHPGDSVILAVSAEAIDASHITYRWYYQDFDENGGYNWRQMENADGASVEIPSVTRPCEFYCLVSDGYGNVETVSFSVRIDNELTVEAESSSVGVASGESAALRVLVTGVDLSGVTYTWYVEGFNDYGDQEWQKIEGETADTLIIPAVTRPGRYYVWVEDGYGSYDSVTFSVYVENHFTAEPVGEQNRTVHVGETADLAVTAAADDASGITFQWYTETYDEGGWYNMNPIDGATSASWTTPAVTETVYYYCIVTDGYKNSVTVWFRLEPTNDLEIEAENDGMCSIEPHTSATLRASVTAWDLSVVTCQWSVEVRMQDEDGNWWQELQDIDGATSFTYVTEALAGPAEYYLRVWDGCGNEYGVWFHVRIENGFYAYAADDGAVRVQPGETAALTVIAGASDDSMLTYTWYHVVYDGDEWMGWEAVEGAHGPTWTTGPVTAPFNCYCLVDDGYGNSENVWFCVCLENNFSLAPQGDTEIGVEPGDSVSLGVVPAGTDLSQVTYRWSVKVYGENGIDYGWESVENADGPTLDVGPVTSAVEYMCTASDGYGNEDSVSFLVYVENHFSASAEGENYLTVHPGETATLTVSVQADDMSGVTFVWYRYVDAISEYVLVQGADGPSVVTEPADAFTEYRCYVSDGYGNRCEVSFLIWVENDVHLENDIDRYELTVNPGETAALTVRATAWDISAVTYQWLLIPGEEWNESEWIEIPGATEPTYVTPAVTGPAEYVCRIFDGCNTNTNCYFIISIENHFSASAEGDSVLIAAPGGSVTAAVTVTGDDVSRVTYQWYREEYVPEYDGNDFLPIPGANDPAYTLTPVNGSTVLRCLASDGYGNNAEVLFSIVVENHLSAWAEEDQPRVGFGQPATLTVNVTADDPAGVTYQWYREEYVPEYGGYDFLPVPGVESAQWTIPSVTDFTTCFCRVTDRYGNTADVWFWVGVENHLALTPEEDPVLAPLHGDAVLRVDVTADDMTGMTYQWYDSAWNEIPGATDNTYTVADVTECAQYFFEAMDRFGNRESIGVMVSVDNHFSISADPDSYVVVNTAGDTAVLRVIPSGDDLTGVTYEWSRTVETGDGTWSDVLIPGETGDTLIVENVTGEMTFSVRAVDRFGNEAWEFFTVGVDNRITVCGGGVYCVEYGEDITLSPTVLTAGPCQLTYTWRDSGYEPIPGQTGPTLTVANVTDSLSYTLCVTDEFGNEARAYFYVRVNSRLIALPVEDVVTVPYGGTAMLSVAASLHNGQLHFDWMDASGEPLPGAEDCSWMTLENVTAPANYMCSVSDSFGNNALVSFRVEVENGFTAAAAESELTFVPVQPFTASVTAHADRGELTYQWTRDGMQLLEETGPSVTVTGAYTPTFLTCVVTDMYGSSRTIGIQANPVDDSGAPFYEVVTVTVPFGGSVDLNGFPEIPGATFTWERSTGAPNAGYTPLEGETGSTLRLSGVERGGVYRCVAQTGDGRFQRVFRVQVENGFTATQETQVVAAAPGETVTLRVLASADSGELTYQWYDRNNQPIHGAAGDSYTVASVTISTDYTCLVTDRYGNTAALRFGVYPVGSVSWTVDADFPVRPVESDLSRFGFNTSGLEEYVISAVRGTDVWIPVTVTGSYHVSWAVFKGRTGADIPWSQPTLVIPSVQTSATYILWIYDEFGNQDMLIFAVEVENAPVEILTQPQDATEPVGGSAVFTVEATGRDLTYQWQYRTSAAGTWKNTTMTGNKTDTLTVPVTAARNGYQYRCVVTGAGGLMAESGAATLFVKTTVTAQPQSVTAPAGDTAVFTVEASGAGLTYQWYYRTSSAGTWKTTTMTGNKTAELSVPVTVARNGYQYRCRITDANGKNTYSKAATLYVKTVVTAQPADVTAPIDDTAVFTVEVSAASPSYQWYYRTSETGTWKTTGMTGAKTAELSVPVTAARNGDQYRCKITDANGKTTYSDAAALFVKTVITTQPTGKTVTAGSTAKFTVAASGAGLTYQWYYRTSATGTWKTTTLTGAKTATLTVKATSARDGYQYRCRITDANGKKTYSKAAALTVKVKITTQPQSVTAAAGDSVKFTVKASGVDLTYQWYYRTSASGTWKTTTLTGAKTATLTVKATSARDGYQYRCVVTDGNGYKATSSAATLTVE